MDFIKKHWVTFVTCAVSIIASIMITKYFAASMPTTVFDRKTDNYLYIGRPIGHAEPHGGYYEFPITLNDGKGEYRIDKYDLRNKVLLIKKQD